MCPELVDIFALSTGSARMICRSRVGHKPAALKNLVADTSNAPASIAGIRYA
jgi:hypothetical protein